MIIRENVNAFWDYVRDRFPDARFDFWYHVGELHFFPDGAAEKRGEIWSCYKDSNGRFHIVSEF